MILKAFKEIVRVGFVFTYTALLGLIAGIAYIVCFSFSCLLKHLNVDVTFDASKFNLSQFLKYIESGNGTLKLPIDTNISLSPPTECLTPLVTGVAVGASIGVLGLTCYYGATCRKSNGYLEMQTVQRDSYLVPPDQEDRRRLEV